MVTTRRQLKSKKSTSSRGSKKLSAKKSYELTRTQQNGVEREVRNYRLIYNQLLNLQNEKGTFESTKDSSCDTSFFVSLLTNVPSTIETAAPMDGLAKALQFVERLDQFESSIRAKKAQLKAFQRSNIYALYKVSLPDLKLQNVNWSEITVEKENKKIKNGKVLVRNVNLYIQLSGDILQLNMKKRSLKNLLDAKPTSYYLMMLDAFPGKITNFQFMHDFGVSLRLEEELYTVDDNIEAKMIEFRRFTRSSIFSSFKNALPPDRGPESVRNSEVTLNTANKPRQVVSALRDLSDFINSSNYLMALKAKRRVVKNLLSIRPISYYIISMQDYKSKITTVSFLERFSIALKYEDDLVRLCMEIDNVEEDLQQFDATLIISTYRATRQGIE